MSKRPARGPRAAPERTHARASGKDGPQIVRTGDHRIGEEEIETFLGHLAATCNASLAAKLTGFSTEAFYHRRDRDPVLAERWRAIVVRSYGDVEEIVLRTAKELLEGRPPPPQSPIRTMTMQDAIQILKLYRGIVTGEGKRAGWRPVPRSLDEMRDSILTKLAAIERYRREQRAAENEAEGGGAEAA